MNLKHLLNKFNVNSRGSHVSRSDGERVIQADITGSVVSEFSKFNLELSGKAMVVIKGNQVMVVHVGEYDLGKLEEDACVPNNAYVPNKQRYLNVSEEVKKESA